MLVSTRTKKELSLLKTIIIDTFVITYENAFEDNHELSRLEANILNTMWFKKFVASVARYKLKNPDATTNDILEEIERLSSVLRLEIPITPDPILSVAIELARNMIETELAKKGLPPSNNINLHATELAKNSPHLLEQAKTIFQARLKAGVEITKQKQKQEPKQETKPNLDLEGILL